LESQAEQLKEQIRSAEDNPPPYVFNRIKNQTKKMIDLILVGCI